MSSMCPPLLDMRKQHKRVLTKGDIWKTVDISGNKV